MMSSLARVSNYKIRKGFTNHDERRRMQAALYDITNAPLYISGGLTPANVAQAIREARPSGVDVASGIEGPDGFKDPARVRAFVQAVRGVPR